MARSICVTTLTACSRRRHLRSIGHMRASCPDSTRRRPLGYSAQELLAATGAGGVRDEFATGYPVLCSRISWSTDRAFRRGSQGVLLRTIRELRPGVSELFIHASLETDDMKRMTGRPADGGWQERATECELFAKDADIRATLEAAGVKRIGYRPLRDLQRRKHVRAGRSVRWPV